MNALLSLSRGIDWLNDRFATIAKWAVFASCAISATNAIVRYGLNYSSNAYLEIQWYLFAGCVMLGAAQVLRVNEHVRVDVIYGLYSGRTQALIDLIGYALFMLPSMLVMIYNSWPPVPQDAPQRRGLEQCWGPDPMAGHVDAAPWFCALVRPGRL